MSNGKTFNAGILGFGMIGKVHAYGYLNLPLYFDPVPLAGPNHPRGDHPAGNGREGAADDRAPTWRPPITAR